MTDAFALVLADTSMGSAVDSLAGSGVSPAMFQSIFWKPRFQAASPIASHIPFLFWAVAAVRPQRVAVLGCDDGVAHFALCQAIDKLNIDCIALGIGFWCDSKKQQPLSQPPSRLTDHQQMLNEQQSKLVSHSSLADLPPPFTESKFNLLLVDLCALPAGELPRIDDLLDALAPGGILLIHGLASGSSPDVHAELSRLQRSHQQLIFDWGQQLALFVEPGLHGQSSFLDSLTYGSAQDVVRPDLAMALRRCGEGLSNTIELSVSEKSLRVLRADSKSLAQDLKTTQDRASELAASIDARGLKIATLQSELFDSRQQLDQSQKQSSALQKKLHELDQQVEDLIDIRKELEAQCKHLEAALDQEREERRAEGSELLQQAAEEKRKQSELEKQVEVLTTARKELEEQRKQLEAQVEQERDTRINETATLAQIAEDEKRKQSELEKQVEVLTTTRKELEDQRKQLEAQVEQERDTRANETAILTQIAEDEKRKQSELEKQVEVLTTARKELEDQRKQLEAQVERERDTRANETAILTQIAEDEKRKQSELEKQVEGLTTARKELEDQRKQLEAQVEKERDTRFNETAILTQIAEDEKRKQSELEKQVEGLTIVRKELEEQRKQLEAQVEQERDTRFNETTILTQLAEDEKRKQSELEKQVEGLTIVRKELEEQRKQLEAQVEQERATRINETATLTQIAEDEKRKQSELEKQVEGLTIVRKELEEQRKQLEAQLEQERDTRANETATLTQIAEGEKRKQSDLLNQLENLSSLRLPDRPLHLWTILTTEVPHVDGHSLTAFIVIDDYSFKCLGVHSFRRFNSSIFVEFLDRLVLGHGSPSLVRIASVQPSMLSGLAAWVESSGRGQIAIPEYSSWCDRFARTILARLRHELLDDAEFGSAPKVKKRIESWFVNQSLMKISRPSNSSVGRFLPRMLKRRSR